MTGKPIRSCHSVLSALGLLILTGCNSDAPTVTIPAASVESGVSPTKSPVGLPTGVIPTGTYVTPPAFPQPGSPLYGGVISGSSSGAPTATPTLAGGLSGGTSGSQSGGTSGGVYEPNAYIRSPSSPCIQSCPVNAGIGVQPCGSTTAVCTPALCNTGASFNGGACAPTGATAQPAAQPYNCTSYVELPLSAGAGNAGYTLPARDPSGSGVCYYYQLNSATIAASPSYETGTDAQDHDQSVLTRNLDVSGDNPANVWHPYLVFKASLGVNLAGNRSLILSPSASSAPSSSAALIIDNVLLVGQYPTGINLDSTNAAGFYAAYGTSNSGVTSTSSGASDAAPAIYFNPAGINLTTNQTAQYASGSTPYSSVGVVTPSPYAAIPIVSAEGAQTNTLGYQTVSTIPLMLNLVPNVPTTLEFRILDAGGTRSLSPIYLMII